ncbi:MAG: DUF2161 family putative PD-(D/E)XK-type phosphodiesterase, partial [Sneathiella sp.]
DLYLPVKTMLEARGYEVKAEVKGCDVVAIKPDFPTVIVELKLIFSLELLLQGVERQTITDDVYIAVLAPDTSLKRKNWRGRQKGYLKLCRKLGLGLMLVDLASDGEGRVTILLDPAIYAPRKNKKKQTRLLAEFRKRAGDPNTGGVNKTKIMTAYRQNALRCAMVLKTAPQLKVAEIRSQSGAENAASILQKNYYGWFERAGRGIYSLTEAGRESLQDNADLLADLSLDGKGRENGNR